MIRVNLSRISNPCKTTMKSLKSRVVAIDTMINEKTGKGSDFLGWTSYANELPLSELKRISKAAERIQQNCDVLVVVGIGGSYLGAKAAIDAINGIVKKSKCEIVYLGNTLSPTYTAQVLDYIKDKKIGINVISKSGTTTEPAIAFRLVAEAAKKCWGPKKYAKYVIATTDARKGALHQMAFAEGFEEFVIPDDVGGRYSVFTPVGLVPMAVAGLDIYSFIEGAKAGIEEYANPDLDTNEAYKYAVIRYIEKQKEKKSVEFLVTYEPHFVALSEWWKQLFGESEGKEKKGLLPASLCFTTDLHSMGQFCQEGTPCFFETTVAVGKYQQDVNIPKTLINFDKLNYLADKPLSAVEDVALVSTLDAHYIDGGVNNVLIELDQMNEYTLGQLMFFFCKACAMSAYLLDVNPFNQPGVEIYKARMKELLKENLMENKMIYQKAFLSEYDEIVKMKNEVKQRIIDENLPIWLNGYPIDEMIKDDIDNQYGRVIKVDNKVIAYATFMPTPIMYPKGNIFKKDNLYSFGRVMVCNKYLSKGVGRKLVESMILEAKSLNSKGLGIAADECNIKATKLYKSLGFEKEGEKDFGYAYLSIFGLYFE